MGWLGRIMGERADAASPLYDAIVARARAPHWYMAGAVPDTVDGRFDMIAAVLAFVLLRLEAEPEGAEPAARLAERFVDDMDGQLRELGVGDIVVGKHIGKMMAMLGGRLGAYREARTADALDAALIRNLYRGAAPADAAVAHVRDALLEFRGRLADAALSPLLAGALP